MSDLDRGTLRRTDATVFALIAFLAINLLCYANSTLFYHEEPRRAIVAQEMLFTGEYIVPHTFEVPYLKKPPFHNWLIALASSASGIVTGFSARAVSVVCFLATALGVYLFLRRRRPEAAFPAFLITATNFLMLFEYGKKAEPDIVMTALAWFTFATYMVNPVRLLPVAGSAVIMSAGLLTKGTSPLFFYPPLLAVWIASREQRARRILFLLLHLVLSLILPALWLWAYQGRAEVGSLVDTLGGEMASRVQRTPLTFFRHLIMFPAEFLLVLMPWPLAWWFARKKAGVKDDVYRACLAVAAIAAVIFTLAPAGKSRYIMPSIPFLAVAMAYHLDGHRRVPIRVQRIAWVVLALGAVACGAWAFVKGFPVQSLLLVVLAAVMVAMARVDLRLAPFAAACSIAAALVMAHGPDRIRPRDKFDSRAAARQIAAQFTKPLPVVVDVEASPIRISFYLETMLGHTVRSSTLPRPERYYYVTVPEGAPRRSEWTVTEMGDAASSTPMQND